MSGAVTAEAIRRAVDDIPAAFRDSPQFVSEPLSAALGRPVVVKVETVNPIGCFKGRGTWLAVRRLAEDGRVGESRGLVVASAGNFGQGVAYAARAAGIPVVVFGARSANPAKVRAMQVLGADVRLVGEDFDAARTAAHAHATEADWELLVDGDDPWITIGAGTMAVEVTNAVERGDLPPLMAIYVPVGNGALIGGVGTWLRTAAPVTEVIGVQAAQAPAMAISWERQQVVETESADTVADGIAVRVPVPAALTVMRDRVDRMLLIGEREILDAQRTISAALPVAVEPSAGVGWAAAIQDAAERTPDGGAIALIVTGGNLPPAS